MKKLPTLVIVLSLAAVAAATAQTPAATPEGRRGPRDGKHGGPGGPAHRGGHPLVRAMDADKNGEPSADEIARASTTLGALDVNADGSVTRDELRPARPAGAPERPADARPQPARPQQPPAGAMTRDGSKHPVDPVMLALDANADGALSAAEIKNASASLNALDANKDGKLTRDELRPLPPAE